LFDQGQKYQASSSRPRPWMNRTATPGWEKKASRQFTF
jgi:hypothetical protein